MEKAVIYARYSSDKQTEQSIEGQIRECELYAQSKNISIIGKYVDRALTGKADKRPDFQRMMKDSGKELFDYILVYQLDRFARNRYDSAHYKHILKKNGVRVLSAKENISDDPSGILMETVLEGMAEYYSAELAQKVKRGMYEGFLKGHSSGSSCFGFDRVPVNTNNANSKTKKFVVNKAEAEIVQKIFDDYIGGKKLKDIKTWLDNNGIKNKNGKPYHLNSLVRVLENKKYIGTLTFGSESRENAIPAIIDKDVFQKAQERINRNKRNPLSFKAVQRFILSGKLFCGVCKSAIVADSGTSHMGTTYRYYKCYNKKRALAKCEKKQVSKEKLEFAVVKATLELLRQKGMMEKIATQVIAYNDELQSNPKIELYERQLAETEKAIQNLLRAVEQGLFNASTQERMLQLESDKADLTWRLDGERINIPIKLDYLDTVYWFKQFADGDIDDKAFRERIIDAFVNKVILWNDKMIIAYNIKGTDGDKVTVEQIIQDYETEMSNPERFDTYALGGPNSAVVEPKIMRNYFAQLVLGAI